ncbi:MAG TPA: MBL fold metallo-hydrolase, partial [Bacteroidia bacterium]|jgi:glyoxylase-like metal-dependent hydrolase (beta-lactamase superfamily II)|nr:MBL fold metallo-hydrolase [Bacteroidia bacterium]
MELYTINTGHFKLDGGAMFGVVPKSLWNKLNPADENNMCSWAMRCLLVQDGKRLILIDNGMGDKQGDKFFGFYYLHGNDTLEKSLNKHGFTTDDITDAFLTHLHFDHCGGSIKWNKDKTGYEPTFKNATYWSTPAHWDWAVNPNPREKASFLKENILPIKESGQLKMLEGDGSKQLPFSVLFAYGHTEAMMLPRIMYKNRPVVFCADLLPARWHIPLPYVMAYDVRPLESLKEKERLLNQFQSEDTVLFFEHDPLTECGTLQKNERGGIVLKDVNGLKEVFS